MPVINYKTLEFSNGYAYKHCRVPLQNQGLVLIRGLNKDEGGFLGAGKSSMWEVFACTQMGKTGKHQRAGDRVYADDIINKQIGKDFAASLCLDVDDKPYEIQMYRGHSRYRNQHVCLDVNAGRNSLIPKEIHITDWIQRNLLQTDELAFFHTIYITQEFANILIAGSESERRNAIVGMFNLGVYDVLQEKVKQEMVRKVQIMSDASALEHELEEIKTKLAAVDLPELERRLGATEIELSGLKQEQSRLLVRYKKITQALEAAKERDKLQADITALLQQARLNLSIRELDTAILNKYQKREARLERRLAELGNLVEIASKKNILQSRLDATVGARPMQMVEDELESVKTEIRTLLAERPIAETKAEINTEINRIIKPSQPLVVLRQQVNDLAREIDQHKLNITSIMKQLECGICPTCHRAFHDEVDGPELHRQLTEARAALQESQATYRNLMTLLSAAEKYQELITRLNDLPEVRDLAVINSEVKKLQSREHVLTSELETNRQRDKIKTALEALPKIPDGLEEELVDIKKKQKATKVRLECLYRALELKARAGKLKLKRSKEELQQLSTDALDNINAVVASLSEATERKTTLELTIHQVHEMQARQLKIEACVGDIIEIRRDVSCLEALKFCFGGNGLKLERFNELMREAIETTVPMYTNILWPDGSVKLNLTDDGNSVKVELARRSGDVIEASLLSGGERHKTGLALLFGLRDLREKYLGVLSNVLIVDEPFGNLDPQGTQALLKILRVLKDRFGSVFVVSHRPEVFGNALWDQTWWAVRENGFATLYTDSTVPAPYIELAQKYLDTATL